MKYKFIIFVIKPILNLSGEVFCLGADRGKVIGKRTVLWHPQLALNHVAANAEYYLGATTK